MSNKVLWRSQPWLPCSGWLHGILGPVRPVWFRVCSRCLGHQPSELHFYVLYYKLCIISIFLIMTDLNSHRLNPWLPTLLESPTSPTSPPCNPQEWSLSWRFAQSTQRRAAILLQFRHEVCGGNSEQPNLNCLNWVEYRVIRTYNNYAHTFGL